MLCHVRSHLRFVRSPNGRPVLVHCTSGKDRTGLFLSYYVCTTEGLSPSDAIREVRRVRPIALTADGWEQFAQRVLAELVSAPRRPGAIA